MKRLSFHPVSLFLSFRDEKFQYDDDGILEIPLVSVRHHGEYICYCLFECNFPKMFRIYRLEVTCKQCICNIEAWNLFPNKCIKTVVNVISSQIVHCSIDTPNTQGLSFISALYDNCTNYNLFMLSLS